MDKVALVAGVGRGTGGAVARRFAAGLLCPDGEPGCLRRVASGNHPDLVLVEPDGKTSLTVDRARATAARASPPARSSSSRRRD